MEFEEAAKVVVVDHIHVAHQQRGCVLPEAFHAAQKTAAMVQQRLLAGEVDCAAVTGRMAGAALLDLRRQMAAVHDATAYLRKGEEFVKGEFQQGDSAEWQHRLWAHKGIRTHPPAFARRKYESADS